MIASLALLPGLWANLFACARCPTISLEVPYETEVVIEGHILPDVRRPEEPFDPSRYAGKYGGLIRDWLINDEMMG